MYSQSPLNYTKDVFKLLRDEGFEKEAPTEKIIIAIKLTTGCINPKKVRNLMMTYKQFGYIEMTNTEFWKIKYWEKVKKDG
jgi:hypothetical protein